MITTVPAEPTPPKHPQLKTMIIAQAIAEHLTEKGYPSVATNHTVTIPNTQTRFPNKSPDTQILAIHDHKIYIGRPHPDAHKNREQIERMRPHLLRLSMRAIDLNHPNN